MEIRGGRKGNREARPSKVVQLISNSEGTERRMTQAAKIRHSPELSSSFHPVLTIRVYSIDDNSAFLYEEEV